jgi:aspartate carbamoyltransferase regulatory subunit
MAVKKVKCANPKCRENFRIQAERYIEQESDESHVYLIPCPYCSKDTEVTLKGKPRKDAVVRD